VTRIVLIVIAIGILLAAWSTTAPGELLAAHQRSASCSISPNPASVGQWYTLSTVNLPTIDPVWLLIHEPNRVGTSTEVYPAADGSLMLPESAPFAGIWTYEFSGLQTNKKYGSVASCSVQVN